ncbi:MAG: ATP-binding cassette domain-containing protein [Galactobacter sp.]
MPLLRSRARTRTNTLAQDDHEPLLVVEDLNLSFGNTRALDHVSLELRRGEITGVVGQNGAGKSSLVSVLSGARMPDSGAMTLDGEHYNPSDADEARSAGVGYVPQSIRMPHGITVAQAIFRTSFRSTLPLEE